MHKLEQIPQVAPAIRVGAQVRLAGKTCGSGGFRLVEKDGRPFDIRDVYRPDQGLIIGELAGDVMETFMFSGDEGQIRSLADRRATVDLNASGLKLLDFSGPIINRIRNELDMATKKEQLINSAYEATKAALRS